MRILGVARALAASRRGVSLKALAEREGWNLRSVYRDRDALMAAGFPVEEPSSGRYRLAEGWAAPNLPGVAPDEIAAFFALRALAETWRTTAIGKPLDRLWTKLSSARGGQGALVPVGAQPWFAVRSPIGIDYRRHDKTIAVFERATRERLAVNCRYRALSTGETTARVVEPGELYWDPALESLYVIGWCRLRKDVRVFALHRFAAAVLTDERFAPRGEARSRSALRGAFRVWRGENVRTVQVRFAAEVAEEIRERTWAPGQRLEEADGADGGVVLTLEVAGLVEVERWILGYGGSAEVLKPAEFRRSAAAKVAAAAARYGAGARRPAERKRVKEGLTPADKAGA